MGNPNRQTVPPATLTTAQQTIGKIKELTQGADSKKLDEKNEMKKELKDAHKKTANDLKKNKEEVNKLIAEIDTLIASDKNDPKNDKYTKLQGKLDEMTKSLDALDAKNESIVNKYTQPDQDAIVSLKQELEEEKDQQKKKVIEKKIATKENEIAKLQKSLKPSANGTLRQEIEACKQEGIEASKKTTANQKIKAFDDGFDKFLQILQEGILGDMGKDNDNTSKVNEEGKNQINNIVNGKSSVAEQSANEAKQQEKKDDELAKEAKKAKEAKEAKAKQEAGGKKNPNQYFNKMPTQGNVVPGINGATPQDNTTSKTTDGNVKKETEHNIHQYFNSASQGHGGTGNLQQGGSGVNMTNVAPNTNAPTPTPPPSQPTGKPTGGINR
jgi:hypothetical protein